MPVISTVNWTMDEVQGFANDIKDLVCSELKIDQTKYIIIVIQKGWFGGIIDRLLGKDFKGFMLKVIKVDKPIVEVETSDKV